MAEIPYTVRLAPRLLERIEKTASERGTSARKLIRAGLAERFGGDSSAHQERAAAQPNQLGLDQILFDLTRTRLTLQHLLDQQLGSEITDQIRQTAQTEAERHFDAAKLSDEEATAAARAFLGTAEPVEEVDVEEAKQVLRRAGVAEVEAESESVAAEEAPAEEPSAAAPGEHGPASRAHDPPLLRQAPTPPLLSSPDRHPADSAGHPPRGRPILAPEKTNS